MRALIHALALAAAFAPLPLAAQTPESAGATAADPARMTAARAAATRLLPDTAAFQAMVRPLAQQMAGAVTSQFMEIPLKQVIAEARLNEQQLRALNPATLRDIVAIVDPAYQQRLNLMLRTLSDEMGAVLVTFEPGVRNGLAEALARRFSRDQLEEINRFMLTPTGAAFGAQVLQLGYDPAIQRALQSAQPKLREAMPSILQKARTATAGLPPVRSPAQLTQIERIRLSELMGTAPAQPAAPAQENH